MWTKHEMARGSLWYRSEGGVLESVATGEIDESNPAVLTKELERLWAKEGFCAAFHNWGLATGYTTRMRVDWIKWATSPAARGAKFTHFLLNRSPLMKMAVSVASIAFAPQVFTVHDTLAAYVVERARHMKPPEPIAGIRNG